MLGGQNSRLLLLIVNNLKPAMISKYNLFSIYIICILLRQTRKKFFISQSFKTFNDIFLACRVSAEISTLEKKEKTIQPRKEPF